MPKFNVTRIIAALIAVEQAHFFVKRYVPQYDQATQTLITNLKRKIGLKKTLWDEVLNFLDCQTDDVDVAFLSSNNTEIDYIIGEESTLIKRTIFPREGLDQMGLSEAPDHVKETLINTDVDNSRQDLLGFMNKDKPIQGLLLKHHPYPLGQYVEQLRPEGLKTSDPNLDLILRSRTRVGGWDDFLHVKFSDTPLIVIRDSRYNGGEEAEDAPRELSKSGILGSSGDTSSNDRAKGKRSRHTILFKKNEETYQFIKNKFPLLEHTFNSYKGCLTKIDNSTRSMRIDTAQSVKMRLTERKVDMDVYPEEVRIAVDSDVTQFVNRSLMKENSKLDSRRSYLFVGPPGCGKTKLVSSIIGELPLEMTALIMTRDTIGELTNINIRYPHVKPLAVIIEDIDIMVARSSERQVLMNFLDGLFSEQKMITIMTANNPKILGNAFIKRPGRIDRIIEIKPGDINVRTAQIGKLIGNRETEIPINEIASLTEGFSFAQHREVINRAALYSQSDNKLEKNALEKATEECKIQFADAGKESTFEEDTMNDDAPFDELSKPVNRYIGALASPTWEQITDTLKELTNESNIEWPE